MSVKVTVMKFGGTSVEDGPAFERVAHIVDSYSQERPVVIVSAMSRVTDALLSSLRSAAQGEIGAARRSLEEHLERHLEVARSLGGPARPDTILLIERVRQEIRGLLESAAASRMTSAGLQDIVASYGERLSASLLTVVLDEHGLPASYVDAGRCILTDEEHGKARPLPSHTRRRTRAELEPLLRAKRIPVLGGFIAATMKGATTTMGRGSSDYTATLVSAALEARETQIWTDVNGVMTADPLLIKTARTVPQLSYAEAEELARFGAKVLHPKMIQPAAEKRIPVRICNSRAPGQTGTLICARMPAARGTVKAIAHKTGMTTVEIISTPAMMANGLRHGVQAIYDRHRTAVDVVAISEVGISLASAETGALSCIIEDLQRLGSVNVRRDRAIISCVGEGLQRAPGNVTKLLSAFREVDSTLTWSSTSSSNCVLVVAADCADSFIRRLHHAIFEHDVRERARSRFAVSERE
jgi:aspartate kinase